MTDREATVVLNMLPGIGPVRVAQMVRILGSPAAILREPPAQLAKLQGIGDKLADVLASWNRTVNLSQEFRLCHDAGVHLLTAADEDYPAWLRQIHDAPLCLYVRGQVAALRSCGDRGLAMVGSRQASLYGEAVTRKLCASAVKAGWAIISGLAHGIDAAAHDATVEHRGITVAVCAGGLAEIYPAENLELARRIVETGALVSEQPMTMRTDKRMFPMRNRIISGLSRGVVVVEAGVRSGALITAQFALDQGRTVFAVPGRVDSPSSGGCHRLIKDGARLVETFDDVLEEFSFLPGMQVRPRPLAPDEMEESVAADPEAPPSPPPVAGDLSPVQQRLVQALQAGEVGLDDLVRRTDTPVGEVLRALSDLELRRVVTQCPGRRYVLYTAARR